MGRRNISDGVGLNRERGQTRIYSVLFKAIVKGTAILFLGLLVIYICRMFLDSGGWGRLILAVFALSAIFEIWHILSEAKHREQ